MLRMIRHLLLYCFFSSFWAGGAVAAPLVWVAVSEEAGPYAEAAESLRRGLGDANLVVGLWPTLESGASLPPDLVITVGQAAFEKALRGLAEKAGSWERVPVLASLLPRAAYEAVLAKGLSGRRMISAALLDQPVPRQMALIKRSLPDRWRVGVLAGPLTQAQMAGLAREAQSNELKLVASPAVDQAEQTYGALKEVLSGADVLLALPDPLIYNSTSLQNILLASYRARVPLVAFSAAYVKAGALLALHVTPAQAAYQVATMARQALGGRGLPAVQMARDFTVVTNPHVAASLGLRLDSAEELTAELRRAEGRP